MEGLNEIFGFVKGDVESLEGDAVSIEVKDSNRPDIWSVEGIARVLRRQLGVGRNTDVKVTGRSSLKVVIDKRVKPIRPFISTAIVKGLQPTEEALKGWIRHNIAWVDEHGDVIDYEGRHRAFYENGILRDSEGSVVGLGKDPAGPHPVLPNKGLIPESVKPAAPPKKPRPKNIMKKPQASLLWSKKMLEEL